MLRGARAKREKFDAIMRKHDAAEQRTLANLRALGYKVKTIHQARLVWAKQKQLPGLTDEQISVVTDLTGSIH